MSKVIIHELLRNFGLQLGLKKSTQSKRPQAVRLLADGVGLAVARQLLKSVPPEQLLFGGISYHVYSKLLADTCQHLVLLRYRPHSGRAGFASTTRPSRRPVVVARGGSARIATMASGLHNAQALSLALRAASVGR